MKKSVLLLSAFLYLFLSVGIRMNTHYCGDKISSVDFFFGKDKSCCGKEDLTKKCCKDKISYFKLSDDQKSTMAFSFAIPGFSEALVPALDHSKTYLLTKQEFAVYSSFTFYDYSIPLGKTPVYIINRSFRV